MAIVPGLLDQVLRTPRSKDVTESPIVRTVILADAANAADLVPSLERTETLEAYNARRILCLFGPDAAPHLLAALNGAGPTARKEGIEVLWALLVSEEARTIRETMAAAQSDFDMLLEDKRALPDNMPPHTERDFRGRICDLAFIVAQQLVNREYDQSPFRSLDDKGRDEEIRRFKARRLNLA